MKKRSIALVLSILMVFSVFSNVLGIGVASAALRQDPLQLDPPACDCGSKEIYLTSHADGCDTKEYFRSLAGCSVDEIGEYWNAVPYSARSFILDCIKANDATKYADAVETLAPYYGYKAETPAGNNALTAFAKVEDTVASLKEPTWDDLGNVYRAMELAYGRAFRNDALKTSVLDLEMLDARFDAMESYLLAVYKYSKFAQNPNDIVMMYASSGSGGNSVRFDSSVTAGKWVSTRGDDFKLTLESWVGGYSTDLSRPSDIVLVLDQSASMYTRIFAYYDFSKYIRENSTVNFEVVDGNIIFTKVRYKKAELVAPENGNKYQAGELILNGIAPEEERMSDEYRVNTVYVTNNKKEGSKTITAIVYTSQNADTVIAYTSGYRIAPTSMTVRTNNT